MQVRNLGLSVPIKYKRIFSFHRFPKDLQDEILAYPEAVENDSDYEDDDAVLRKYSDDPVRYIISQD